MYNQGTHVFEKPSHFVFCYIDRKICYKDSAIFSISVDHMNQLSHLCAENSSMVYLFSGCCCS